MNIELLRAFLGWCTVINGAFLLLAFLFCAMAGEWIYKMHSKWFPITREAFTLTTYCFMGGMKFLVIMLNLVPYLALAILR
jgi:hypothetical protein